MREHIFLVVTAAATVAAIVARFTGAATEELGACLGHRIGGILDATVGKVGEISLCIFALKTGLVDLVDRALRRTGALLHLDPSRA